jgi:hypothetical protein
MFPRRRRPARDSRNNEERQDKARGEGLYRQIRHWLLAMEQYHNLDNAPQRPFTTSMCTGTGNNHWNHVVRMPRQAQRKTFLQVASPLDSIPEEQLQANVIQRLKDEGFRVDEPRKLSCGCMMFIVRPRKLA